MQRLRRALEPVIRRILHFYWRFSRGATLGARAMVIDGAGRIFLIKHSYVDGWHLPGGGVETGETFWRRWRVNWPRKAIFSLAARHSCTAVFFNKRSSRRDHVALFIVRDFRQDGHPQPNHEIIEHGFFAPRRTAGRCEPCHACARCGGFRWSGDQRIVVIC